MLSSMENAPLAAPHALEPCFDADPDCPACCMIARWAAGAWRMGRRDLWLRLDVYGSDHVRRVHEGSRR